jgi:hypothetical protein
MPKGMDGLDFLIYYEFIENIFFSFESIFYSKQKTKYDNYKHVHAFYSLWLLYMMMCSGKKKKTSKAEYINNTKSKTNQISDKNKYMRRI